MPTLVTNFASMQTAPIVYTPPGGWPPIAHHLDSTVEGRSGNTVLETIYGTNGRDVVYGNGGSDYITTGNGDDKLVAGSNTSLWHGSGNEFTMGATTLDGGSGNDDFIISGKTGGFQIITGDGQDDVTVNGGDYVRTNAYDGAETARDTFTFGANFNGDAEIWGVDAQDMLTLKGGDWYYDQVEGHYENSTGGTVTLTGVTHGYNDPDVVFA